jgi:hypothetical protein
VPGLSQSFAGINDTGQLPPDTCGAVGPSHIVMVVNGGYTVFRRSDGAAVQSKTLQGFWSDLGLSTAPGQPANRVFDPKVLYDQYSGRFVVVSLGNFQSPDSWLNLAVSDTSDPTGTWKAWAIDADLDGGTQQFNNWADFPCLGLNETYITVSANMFDNGDAFQYSKMWVFDKSSLLAGAATPTVTEFRGLGSFGFTLAPSHSFGAGAAQYVLSEGWTDGTNVYLRLGQVSGPANAPSYNDLGFIQVASYSLDSLPTVPQSGTSRRIDTGDQRLGAPPVFRDGSLWVTHTVSNSSNTKTEVAWYQINPLTLTVVQQGRISDSTRFYFYPSIAVNGSGEVAIGMAGCSASQFPGGYYTGRKASDASGTTQSVSLLKAGEAAYNPGGTGAARWGDYSATVLDPADDRTFWTFQEYSRSSSAWGTWIGSYRMALSSGTPFTQIVAGLGVRGLAWVETLSMEGGAPNHATWLRVPWSYFWTTSSPSVRVASGDVDGDGRDEVVLGTGPSGLGWAVLLDDETTGYATLGWVRLDWSAYTSGSDASVYPACADLNGDGKDEIVLGTGPGGLGWCQIYTYNGGSSFTPFSGTPRPRGWLQVSWSSYVSSGNAPVYPAGGDMNGDGREELVLGLGPGGAGWVQAWTYDGSTLTPYSGVGRSDGWLQVGWSAYQTSGKAPTYPALGDLDNDGLDDLVLGLGDGSGAWVRIFRSTGTGVSAMPGTPTSGGWVRVNWSYYQNSGAAPTYPACGDVDGDGDDDLLLGLGDNGLGWMYAVTGTSFTTPTVWGTGFTRVAWSYYTSGASPTYPAIVRTVAR